MEINLGLQKILRFCTLDTSFTHFQKFNYLKTFLMSDLQEVMVWNQ